MLTTPGQPLFSTWIEDADGRRTVVCRGELDLSTAGQLASAIEQLTASDLPVRLDMARTTFMDSAGVNTLVRAHTNEQRLGRAVTLRSPSEAVRRTLAMAGIEPLFPVEEPALA